MKPYMQLPVVAVIGVCLSLPVSGDESELVAPDATPVKLADGFKFTEGPAADAKGNVFFSDIPNERIHKWSLDGRLTTFREKSGRANGLFFDKDGNLLACEGGSRRVTKISMDGEVTVLADAYQEKKLTHEERIKRLKDLPISCRTKCWRTSMRESSSPREPIAASRS